MKKLSLLIAVIMSMLVFSVVFATEEDTLLIAPAPEQTEENVNEEEMTITSENPEETTDGETVTAPEDTTTPDSVDIVEDDTTSTKSNSTIVGAIIAIVIVVVVVALAALIQKK